MSVMHSMVFHMCKRGKRQYSPDVPQDYPAKRAAEVRQNRFVTVPRSVCIGETVLGGGVPLPAAALDGTLRPEPNVIRLEEYHG